MTSFLTLYQFPGPWDVFSASPFCAKLEAFLRWQQVPHKAVTVSRLKGAPKGKVPYIEDANGKRGDSNLIIDYLCSAYGLSPDAALSAEQKAVARSITYLCEESIYRIMAYMRFVDSEGWAKMQALLFAKYPAVVRWLVAPRIHAYVKKQLTQQGIARHSRDEIVAIGRRDVDALSAMLGNKPYFFGEDMTSVDITVFSVIGNLITGPFQHEVALHAASHPNLAAHMQRVKNHCFSG
jgi:glutathione S-transferase